MKALIFAFFIIPLGLIFQNCAPVKFNAGADQLSQTQAVSDIPFCTTCGSNSDNFVFFAFSKAKPTDPQGQQQTATDSTNLVKNSLKTWNLFNVDVLNENILTSTSAPSLVLVTKSTIKEKFEAYAATLTANDTFVVYTHTHGIQNTPNVNQPRAVPAEGGLLISNVDLTERMAWSEYAELLLALPAKNVIVFTMACFSGGLIDYLNSGGVKERWQNRKNEGRNFIVISAQNSILTAVPSRINGELMNALPFAISQAFLGKADGYNEIPDGHISLGELEQYVLYTSRNAGKPTNTNDSQLTGSYNPKAILK